MKLEIDIDEDYYKIICKRVEENKPYHSPYEYEVIADGKPIEQEPTTKNDLGVDCISRAEMLKYQEYLHGKMSNEENHKLWEFIKDLPSVTPQEPTDKNFTKADIDAIVKAINEGWELRVNEILSKIRAEISTVYESLDGYDPDSLGAFVSKIDEIFDRYKAEREADNG